MGIVKVVADDKKCVGCEICELTCTNVNFGVNNPKKSAICINRLAGPEGFHVVLCNQCGKCAKECPEEAIALVNGGYRIDEEQCTLCGVCVEVCPTEAIWWRPNVKTPIKCISCRACVYNCPTQALSYKEIALQVEAGMGGRNEGLDGKDTPGESERRANT